VSCNGHIGEVKSNCCCDSCEDRELFITKHLVRWERVGLAPLVVVLNVPYDFC
jgi:hypothetical protein